MFKIHRAMIKNFPKVFSMICAFAALAQAQTPALQTPTPTAPAQGQVVQGRPQANAGVSEWVVSIIHKVDVQKMLERMRKETNARVGVPGSMPEFIYNVTTGVVIDDAGHIITRLANLNPEEKEQTIFVVTNTGISLPAKFIGLDCPSGFAVLEVPTLKIQVPESAKNISQGKLVKILSADITQKGSANSNGSAFDIFPAIKVLGGQLAIDSPYAKARGVLTLHSANLRSRNDSSIVTTIDNQLLGVAQYVGFGRAYLFPIDLIRNTIAKRVLEKKATVLTGWLGVSGLNLFQLSPKELSELGVDRKAGVLVKEVSPDSPAAQSGIKPNDVIVGLDEFDVTSTNDLGAFLSSSPSGQSIKLRTIRNREPLEFNVVLGSKMNPQPMLVLPQFQGQAQTTADQIDETKRRIEELQAQYKMYLKVAKSDEREESLKELSIELQELFGNLRVLEDLQAKAAPTPSFDSFGLKQSYKSCTLKPGFTAREMSQQLAANFGTPKSILVDTVVKSSAAELAGLQVGDVIVGSIGEPLTCAQTEALFARFSAPLTLKVIRQKRALSVIIKQ